MNSMAVRCGRNGSPARAIHSGSPPSALEGLTLRSPDEEYGEHEFLAVRARDEQWAAEAVIWSGYAKLILWLDTWHWARVGVFPDAGPGGGRARRDPPDA